MLRDRVPPSVVTAVPLIPFIEMGICIHLLAPPIKKLHRTPDDNVQPQFHIRNLRHQLPR